MKLMSKVSVLLLSVVFSAPLLAVEGDASAGKDKAAVCGACHGQGGNSGSPAYPKLAGQEPTYLAKQLHDFKSGARDNAIMKGQVSGLSDQDIADIAAYYATQKIEIGKTDPELLALGEKIYRGGNMSTGLAACSGCHGPSGQGLDGAGFPALGGQHAGYIEAQLKAFRAAGREDLGDVVKRNNDADPDAPGMMQTTAAKMSDKEIQAVSSFISGLGK